MRIGHYQRTREYFDRVALSKSGRYDDESSLAFKLQKKIRQAALGLISNNSEKIIDIGCGMGDFTLYLANKFPNNEFVGIDFSEKMVALANEMREKSAIENVTFEVGNITETGLGSNEFDTLICANVLHHIEKGNISKVLSEFARITKSEMIIEIKNSLCPYYLVRKLKIIKATGLDTYGNSIGQLNRLCGKSGFIVTEYKSLWNLGRYLSPNIVVKLEANSKVPSS